MHLEINPASGFTCPEDHLYYFQFVGGILGKALFDQQVVKHHIFKYLYKHILAWPIMFGDLNDLLDEEYYNSLKGLRDMGADMEYVGVHFTIVEDLGAKYSVELIPDGANVDVTEENLPEFIGAYLKYRLFGRYEQQINELLLGFFDVIPEPFMSIFDYQAKELELLMCRDEIA
jgi:E3 ubiquitin-protein ligase NEDD4